MVIDHMAKPPIASGEFERWARALERVARIETVYCKLSGLVTEARHEAWTNQDLKPYVAHALSCFGAGRVMFGSDYPVCLLAASYDRVLDSFMALTANLNETEQQAIFAANAKRFYRIGD